MSASALKVAPPMHRDVVHACAYHVVWCAKYRRSVLTPEVAAALAAIVREVCAQKNARLVELSIEAEHVQLRVEVDPQYGIHRLVKQIKAVSSRALRADHAWLKSRLPTLWSNSYFVSTATDAPRTLIRDYIEAQPRTP